VDLQRTGSSFTLLAKKESKRRWGTA